MTYEVITTDFRTELHARWSVFFDHLRVPWAYEPVTFYDSQGPPSTPPFWHMAEWQHNPQDIKQARYKNRTLWR